ncbi:MAG: terminase family protein [Desulfovibrio sp.]|jgi:hypothetical protein|nr:terminase family protein [Desulfovibrio sp.]
MAGIEITIPYTPRRIQRELHSKMDATRFVVLVAHRRMGKTVLAVNHLIKHSLTSGKERAVYGYVAPYRNQAKAIAWEYLKHYTAPLPGRHVNEQELTIQMPNGAKIRIFGADNPDALRGMYFDGVIMDEVAQMRQEVWQEIIRPALADRGGWAVFIGTPKGINLFHEIYIHAQRDLSGDWKAFMYRVTDTDAISHEELEKLKAEMSENAFRQEFLCDFSASADDVLISINDAVLATERAISHRDVRAVPMVVGVDVARFGSDSTVFFPRRGLLAFEPLVFNGLDSVDIAQRLVSFWHEHHPEMIFIDAGQGQGVIDIANKVLPCVVEVPFGGKALSEAKFLNRRSEMWFLMREWIRAGGSIPNNSRLLKELSAPTYQFNAAGKIQLEAKDKIVERLGFSPDLADALALTFAMPVMPRIEGRQEYAQTSAGVLDSYYSQQQEYADGLQPSFFG